MVYHILVGGLEGLLPHYPDIPQKVLLRILIRVELDLHLFSQILSQNVLHWQVQCLFKLSLGKENKLLVNYCRALKNDDAVDGLYVLRCSFDNLHFKLSKQGSEICGVYHPLLEFLFVRQILRIDFREWVLFID